MNFFTSISLVSTGGTQETPQLGQHRIVAAVADVDHERLVVVVIVVARELPVEDTLEKWTVELGVGLPESAHRPGPLLRTLRLVAPDDDVFLGLARRAVGLGGGVVDQREALVGPGPERRPGPTGGGVELRCTRG